MPVKPVNSKPEEKPILLNGVSITADMNVPYSFLHLNGYSAFIEKFDSIAKERGAGATTGVEWTKDIYKHYGQSVGWYGKPLPTSWEDAVGRDTFLWYKEYQEFKDAAKEEFNKLMNTPTFAELLAPKFIYNDKELGTFSFDKASMGLLPSFHFYSFDKKKIIEDSDIITNTDGEKTYYTNKNDLKDIITVCYKINIVNESGEIVGEEYIPYNKDVEIDMEYVNSVGFLDVYSDVKKSFLYKEEVIRPVNAIRLFIQTDADAGVDAEAYKFNGYLACALAEFFDGMGYKTSIVVLFGNRRYDYNQSGRAPIEGGKGIRWASYEAKKFTENLYADKLLYTTCDPTYMRIKTFLYSHLISDYYGDKLNAGIGGSPTIGECLGTVLREFKKVDKHTMVMYYMVQLFGGYSSPRTAGEAKTEALKRLRELITNVENENKKLREQRGFVAME